MSTAHLSEDTEYFYRNSQMHEMLFVHHGKGVLLTEYGKINFAEWDYLIIPKGTTYQIKFDDYKTINYLLLSQILHSIFLNILEMSMGN